MSGLEKLLVLFEDENIMEKYLTMCKDTKKHPNPAVWGFHFTSAVQNQVPSLTNYFNQVFDKIQMNYAFIKENSVLKGKAYDELNIPNVGGNINGYFLNKFLPYKKKISKLSKIRINRKILERKSINKVNKSTEEPDPYAFADITNNNNYDPYNYTDRDISPLKWIPKPSFKCLQSTKNIYHPDFKSSLQYRKSRYDHKSSYRPTLFDFDFPMFHDETLTKTYTKRNISINKSENKNSNHFNKTLDNTDSSSDIFNKNSDNFNKNSDNFNRSLDSSNSNLEIFKKKSDNINRKSDILNNTKTSQNKNKSFDNCINNKNKKKSSKSLTEFICKLRNDAEKSTHQEVTPHRNRNRPKLPMETNNKTLNNGNANNRVPLSIGKINNIDQNNDKNFNKYNENPQSMENNKRFRATIESNNENDNKYDLNNNSYEDIEHDSGEHIVIMEINQIDEQNIKFGRNLQTLASKIIKKKKLFSPRSQSQNSCNSIEIKNKKRVSWKDSNGKILNNAQIYQKELNEKNPSRNIQIVQKETSNPTLLTKSNIKNSSKTDLNNNSMEINENINEKQKINEKDILNISKSETFTKTNKITNSDPNNNEVIHDNINAPKINTIITQDSTNEKKIKVVNNKDNINEIKIAKDDLLNNEIQISMNNNMKENIKLKQNGLENSNNNKVTIQDDEQLKHMNKDIKNKLNAMIIESNQKSDSDMEDTSRDMEFHNKNRRKQTTPNKNIRESNIKMEKESPVYEIKNISSTNQTVLKKLKTNKTNCAVTNNEAFKMNLRSQNKNEKKSIYKTNVNTEINIHKENSIDKTFDQNYGIPEKYETNKTLKDNAKSNQKLEIKHHPTQDKINENEIINIKSQLNTENSFHISENTNNILINENDEDDFFTRITQENEISQENKSNETTPKKLNKTKDKFIIVDTQTAVNKNENIYLNEEHTNIFNTKIENFYEQFKSQSPDLMKYIQNNVKEIKTKPNSLLIKLDQINEINKDLFSSQSSMIDKNIATNVKKHKTLIETIQSSSQQTNSKSKLENCNQQRNTSKRDYSDRDNINKENFLPKLQKLEDKTIQINNTKTKPIHNLNKIQNHIKSNESYTLHKNEQNSNVSPNIDKLIERSNDDNKKQVIEKINNQMEYELFSDDSSNSSSNSITFGTNKVWIKNGLGQKLSNDQNEEEGEKEEEEFNEMINTQQSLQNSKEINNSNQYKEMNNSQQYKEMDQLEKFQEINISTQSTEIYNSQRSNEINISKCSKEINNSSQNKDMNNSQKSKQMNNLPQYKDLNISQKSEQMNNSPQYKDMNNSQKSEQMNNSPQYKDMNNSQKSKQMNNSPQYKDLNISQKSEQMNNSPQYKDLNISQKSKQMNNSPQYKDMNNSQKSKQMNNSPQYKDMNNLQKSKQMNNSPQYKDMNNSQKSIKINTSQIKTSIQSKIKKMCQEPNATPKQSNFQSFSDNVTQILNNKNFTPKDILNMMQSLNQIKNSTTSPPEQDKNSIKEMGEQFEQEVDESSLDETMSSNCIKMNVDENVCNTTSADENGTNRRRTVASHKGKNIQSTINDSILDETMSSNSEIIKKRNKIIWNQTTNDQNDSNRTETIELNKGCIGRNIQLTNNNVSSDETMSPNGKIIHEKIETLCNQATFDQDHDTHTENVLLNKGYRNIQTEHNEHISRKSFDLDMCLTQEISKDLNYTKDTSAPFNSNQYKDVTSPEEDNENESQEINSKYNLSIKNHMEIMAILNKVTHEDSSITADRSQSPKQTSNQTKSELTGESLNNARQTISDFVSNGNNLLDFDEKSKSDFEALEKISTSANQKLLQELQSFNNKVQTRSRSDSNKSTSKDIPDFDEGSKSDFEDIKQFAANQKLLQAFPTFDERTSDSDTTLECIKTRQGLFKPYETDDDITNFSLDETSLSDDEIFMSQLRPIHNDETSTTSNSSHTQISTKPQNHKQQNKSKLNQKKKQENIKSNKYEVQNNSDKSSFETIDNMVNHVFREFKLSQ